MVDLIFVIDGGTAQEWHAENLRMQPHHYARFLSSLGPGAISRVQSWGPGLYFNPLVHLPTVCGDTLHAKYGVITFADLLRDLADWDSLYVAGRLHKPCRLDFHTEDEQLRRAVVTAVGANRRAALSAAMLLSSNVAKHASEVDLFSLLCAIVRLSFDGDVRLGVAEHPNKVANIVHGQAVDLWEAYHPIATALGADVSNAPLEAAWRESGVIAFDTSRAGLLKLFGELPVPIQNRALAKASGGAPWESVDLLRGVFRGTVRRSSFVQTAKGVFTAGAARGARYAFQKIAKRLA